MTIDTKPFGRMEIEERQVVTFPHGLYGFEALRRFALLDSPQPPFYWLQSLEQTPIAFVLVNPYLVRSDYLLDVSEADIATIDDPQADDLLVFSIVTIPDDRSEVSCNLQGPILMNRRTRNAVQAISLDPRWRTKHYLLQETGARG